MDVGISCSRLLSAQLFTLTVQQNIVTAEQLQYIAKTIAVLLVVQSCPLNFNSLVQIQGTCIIVAEISKQRPGHAPTNVEDLLAILEPNRNLELKSCAVWAHRPHLDKMKVRVPECVESLRRKMPFSSSILPTHKLHSHNALVKTVADVLFQLELWGEYLKLLQSQGEMPASSNSQQAALGNLPLTDLPTNTPGKSWAQI